ncbi:MAG: tetratricopeptide repeat protein, partial [Planctomycetota bacterium]
MKRARVIRVLMLIVGTCSFVVVPAMAETIGQLEERVRANPGSVEANEELAEAYLRQCELEKSVKLWREILADNPEHERARFVVSRLTLVSLDLDSHVQVIETLIDKGVTEGTDSLIETASRRAATDSQKARILYLR